MKNLVFISADGEQLTYVLHDGSHILGEGKGCDITFVNQELDDHHSEIVFSSDGVRVRDLESRLGTFVNGVRVMDAFLQHGDRLMFGRLEAGFDAGEDLRMLGGKALPGSVAPPLRPSSAETLPGSAMAVESKDVLERERLLGGLESVILKRQSELGKVGEQRRQAEESLRMLQVRKQELEAHVAELEEFAKIGEGEEPADVEDFSIPHEFASEPHLTHVPDTRTPRTLADLEQREDALVKTLSGGSLADAHSSLFSRPAKSSQDETIVPIAGEFVEDVGVTGALDVLDLAQLATHSSTPWVYSEMEEIPPVGWYAAARATGGRIHLDVGSAILSSNPILVLSNGDWDSCLQAVGMIRAGGRRVFLGWSGGGGGNLARSLKGGAGFQRLRYLCSHVEGVLTFDQIIHDNFKSLVGANRCHLLPAPCPIDRPGWNFSIPQIQRKGILLGDGGLDPENPDSILYLDFLLDLANFCDTTISVFGKSNHPGWRKLNERGSSRLNLIPTPEGYQDFLRVLGAHRIAISVNPTLRHGSLAGDALLCRTVALSSDRGSLGSCFSEAKDPFDQDVGVFITRLMQDGQAYEDQITSSQASALKTVSFEVFREQFAAMLSQSAGEAAVAS